MLCNLYPKVSLFTLLFMVFVGGAWSCSENSTVRICEPIRARGCPNNQRCTLDSSARPVCKPLGDESLLKGMGDVCTASEECMPGLGCVERFGMQVCAHFCTNDRELRFDYSCGSWGERTKNWVSMQSEIRQQIFETQICALQTIRPDISLCLAPCLPWATNMESGACDQNNQFNCNFNPHIPFAVCMQNGVADLKEECGVTQQCKAPYACMQDFETQQCLPVVSDDHLCPPYHLMRFLSGKQDPVTGSLYGSCWETVGLAVVDNEYDYRISLQSVSFDQTQDSASPVCQSAQVASPSSSDTLDVILQESRFVLDEIRKVKFSLIQKKKQAEEDFWEEFASSEIIADMSITTDMQTTDMLTTRDMMGSDNLVVDDLGSITDMIAPVDQSIHEDDDTIQATWQEVQDRLSRDYDWLSADESHLWVATDRTQQLMSTSTIRAGWVWSDQTSIDAELIDISPEVLSILSDSGGYDVNQFCLSMNVVTQRFTLRQCSDLLPVLCAYNATQL